MIFLDELGVGRGFPTAAIAVIVAMPRVVVIESFVDKKLVRGHIVAAADLYVWTVKELSSTFQQYPPPYQIRHHLPNM